MTLISPLPRWPIALTRALAVGAGLALTAATAAGSDSTWPQWRGPTRDGLVAGPFPTNLQPGSLERVWRVELGPSYSGPIVAADRVFTTETRDRRYEAVIALDRTTGHRLWQRQWEGALSVPFFAKSNGDWIRATPAYDGQHLYVAGMRDVLVCLEGASGEERWRVDFMKQLGTPLPAFGYVSSPLIDGDALFTQAGASVVRLDKRSGAVQWRALADEGGMWGSAFSSPQIATLGGLRQLIVQTRQVLAGVDLATGEVFWRQDIPAFRGMNILTPVVLGDTVFTSTYGGKTSAFRVARENGRFTVAPLWSFKAQGYMSTPVVIDGRAYHHLRSQRLTCIDLAQGSELWTTTESFGKYMSLVGQGDRVLALDQRGTLLLFRANPARFELLDKRPLTESETWAHLAVAGTQLFVRELDALAAYSFAGPRP